MQKQRAPHEAGRELTKIQQNINTRQNNDLELVWRPTPTTPMIARRLTGASCRCAACGEYFNSVSVFDRHRVGNWEARGANRRCFATDEMLSRGWRLNARGFWIERPRLDTARRRRDLTSPATPGQPHESIASDGQS